MYYLDFRFSVIFSVDIVIQMFANGNDTPFIMTPTLINKEYVGARVRPTHWIPIAEYIDFSASVSISKLTSSTYNSYGHLPVSMNIFLKLYCSIGGPFCVLCQFIGTPSKQC